MIGCVDSCPHFVDDASGKTRNLGGNYKSSLLILSKCLKLKTKKKKKYNCCFMTPLTLKSGSLQSNQICKTERKCKHCEFFYCYAKSIQASLTSCPLQNILPSGQTYWLLKIRSDEFKCSIISYLRNVCYPNNSMIQHKMPLLYMLVAV